MKIDSEIMEKTMINIKAHLKGEYALVKKAYRELGDAKSPAEFMRLKANLIYQILEMIPLGSANCYYCNIYNRDSSFCKACEYGQKHGICIENGSDFSQLIEKITDLQEFVCDNYGKV